MMSEPLLGGFMDAARTKCVLVLETNTIGKFAVIDRKSSGTVP